MARQPLDHLFRVVNAHPSGPDHGHTGTSGTQLVESGPLLEKMGEGTPTRGGLIREVDDQGGTGSRPQPQGPDE